MDGFLPAQRKGSIPATLLRPPRPCCEGDRGPRVPAEDSLRLLPLKTRERAVVSTVRFVGIMRSAPVFRRTLTNGTPKPENYDGNR